MKTSNMEPGTLYMCIHITVHCDTYECTATTYVHRSNNNNYYNINIIIIFVDFICLYIKFSQIFKFYNVNRVRQA